MKTSNGHDTFSNKRNFGLPCRMCAPCARPPNNAINYQSCPDDSWRRHSRLIARGRAVYIMVALPQPTKSRTATSENCHTASKRRALAVWLTESLFVLLRKHRQRSPSIKFNPSSEPRTNNSMSSYNNYASNGCVWSLNTRSLCIVASRKRRINCKAVTVVTAKNFLTDLHHGGSWHKLRKV